MEEEETACVSHHTAVTGSVYSQISGVTIVTPIRNDPGHVRSPHAGRLIPNHLPMGKKAEIRPQIDLPNRTVRPLKSGWSVRER